jgi:ketosteroid isomerase-like protein
VGTAIVFACLIVASPLAAQSRPGLGGNVGETRTAAAAYRAQVRNIVGQLTAELAEVWDDVDVSRPLAFYDANATITLGPDETIQGKAEIRKAFGGPLGRMRGVLFTLDEFDMSDELMFVRGTMAYEIVQSEGPSLRQTMIFTMSLRLKRGDWKIQSHTIAGPAVLPR